MHTGNHGRAHRTQADQEDPEFSGAWCNLYGLFHSL
jgi:hypothetical protein